MADLIKSKKRPQTASSINFHTATTLSTASSSCYYAKWSTQPQECIAIQVQQSLFVLVALTKAWYLLKMTGIPICIIIVQQKSNTGVKIWEKRDVAENY